MDTSVIKITVVVPTDKAASVALAGRPMLNHKGADENVKNFYMTITNFPPCK